MKEIHSHRLQSHMWFNVLYRVYMCSVCIVLYTHLVLPLKPVSSGFCVHLLREEVIYRVDKSY